MESLSSFRLVSVLDQSPHLSLIVLVDGVGGKGSHHHQPFHPVIRCLSEDGLSALCPGYNQGDNGLAALSSHQRFPHQPSMNLCR